MKNLIYLICGLMFIIGCGSSSINFSNENVLPEITQSMVLDYSTKKVITGSDDVINKVEAGMPVYVTYQTDTTFIINEDSSLTEIPISFVLLSANDDCNICPDNSEIVEDVAILGSEFFNKKGDRVELLIPYNVDTGIYKIAMAVDIGEMTNVSNRHDIHSVTGKFEITNDVSMLVEITEFKASSRVAVYSTDDNQTYGQTNSGDSVIARPTHLHVNAEITLRGDVLEAPDTTYVGFYIELWQDEYQDNPNYMNELGIDANDPMLRYINDSNENINLTPDNIWADLNIIDRESNDKFGGSTEKLYSYFPIAVPGKSDTLNNTVSIGLDLWMPDTTIKLVNYIDTKIQKTVWRVVMFVHNTSIDDLYQRDWNLEENYRDYDYVRFIRINSEDLFPDGSRAIASEIKHDHWLKESYRNDETGENWKHFGSESDFYAESYNSSKGYFYFGISHKFNCTMFGKKGYIYSYKEEYVGKPTSIGSSYHERIVKVAGKKIYHAKTQLNEAANGTIAWEQKPLLWFTIPVGWGEWKLAMKGLPIQLNATLDLTLGADVGVGMFWLREEFVTGPAIGLFNNVVGVSAETIYDSGSHWICLGGQITPYLDATGLVAAGLGYNLKNIANVGIRAYGKLKLLRWQMPITFGKFASPTDEDGETLKFEDGRFGFLDEANFDADYYKSGFSISIHEVLSTLDGEIGVNLTIPWVKTKWCKKWGVPYPCGLSKGRTKQYIPIVNWKGFSYGILRGLLANPDKQSIIQIQK